LVDISAFDREEISCLAYGVGHGEEGVCLLVQMGPYRVLLDCGMADIAPLLDADRRPCCDLVICTHAHRDRARGLLYLHRAAPHLPIYSSEVTSQLLPLNWLEESEPIPHFAQALPWQCAVEFQDGLVAELFPAGHLPGAAAVLLTYTSPQRVYRLFYSGDFFLSNSRLVEGFHLETIRNLQPDVSIIESNYGTSRHAHRRQQENNLMARIDAALARQQSIVFPLDTIGIAQELLILLRSHHLFTGRDVDIWVDGAIAVGCDNYLELISSFPPSIQNFARHQSLFWDEKVRPCVRRWQESSELGTAPCIILSDRLQPLDRDRLDRLQPLLIFVPEGVSLPGNLPSDFQIETYLLAEHSDGGGTTQLIHNLRPKHVMFVAGDRNYIQDLTALEELQNRYHLHAPSAGTLVPFPIGDTFIQPAPPIDPHYEGELTELDTTIEISLPHALANDSRWHNFSDTGTIEARWQGNEIVLRGISQRELIQQDRYRTARANDRVESCANCRYQRGYRCHQESSPLYTFKVPFDGYCPSFEFLSPSNP
jgi:Cft2 family RNA processing exonuclease